MSQEKKLHNIEVQYKAVCDKIAKLEVTRTQLITAYQKLKEPKKEPTVTEEQRNQQSQRDKESYAKNLEQTHTRLREMKLF
jgi:hypothetical protein